MLCQSIGRIAFIYVPGFDSILGAVKSQSAGDTIMINISTLLEEQELESKLSRRFMLQETLNTRSGTCRRNAAECGSIGYGNQVLRFLGISRSHTGQQDNRQSPAGNGLACGMDSLA